MFAGCEKINGNFIFPRIFNGVLSADLMEKFDFFKANSLGIISCSFSLLKKVVDITGNFREFPESKHAFICIC